MTIESIIIAAFGEFGKDVVFGLSLGITAWSQLRQLIPAKTMSKLPSWLISTLEYLAANRGQSSNGNALNPKLWRDIRKGK